MLCLSVAVGTHSKPYSFQASLSHCAIYNISSKTFSGSHIVLCTISPVKHSLYIISIVKHSLYIISPVKHSLEASAVHESHPPTQCLQNSRARNATAPQHHELWSHPPWQCTLTYSVSTYSPTQERSSRTSYWVWPTKAMVSGNCIHILTVTKSKLTSQRQQLYTWECCLMCVSTGLYSSLTSWPGLLRQSKDSFWWVHLCGRGR